MLLRPSRVCINFCKRSCFFSPPCRPQTLATALRSQPQHANSTLTPLRGAAVSVAASMVSSSAQTNQTDAPPNLQVPTADITASQELRDAKVVVVTTAACPYCKAAKAALKERGIPFTELAAGELPLLRQAIRDVTGSRTVPQIFVNGASIGGSDDLSKALNDSSFQAKLDASTAPALPESLFPIYEKAQAARIVQGELGGSADVSEETPNRLRLRKIAARMALKEGGVPCKTAKLGQRIAHLTFSAEDAIDWLVINTAPVESSHSTTSTLTASSSGLSLHTTNGIVTAIEEAYAHNEHPDPSTVPDLAPGAVAGLLETSELALPHSIANLTTMQQADLRATAAVTAQALLEAHLIAPVAEMHPADEAVRFVPRPVKQHDVGDSGSSRTEEIRYVVVSDPDPEGEGPGVVAPLDSVGGLQPALGQALNVPFWWYGQARDASKVATEVRGLILQLYEKYISADGRKVSYKRMAADPLFTRYVHATAELQKLDLSPLYPEELTALFINLYNALVLHALVVHGPTIAEKQRGRFFSSYAKYIIATQPYSADDMENGVLRGNRPGAGGLLKFLGLGGMAKGPFNSYFDARRSKIVKQPDPRVHFALVCGAKSCPPIKLYTPDNLEEGLAAAGEAFCNGGGVVVQPETRTVKLSMVFKWYASDFGQDDRQRLRFVCQFLTGDAKKQLNDMLLDGGSIKVQHLPYDWGINAAEE